MTIIGIDPGASGALCFTNSEEQDIHTHKCHKLISGRRLSVSMALNAYKSKKAIVYIEKVHAMPHDGRSSLFKFGVNYGAWLGILASYQIHTIQVSPQKWMNYWQNKKQTKLPKIKKERKHMLKLWADEMSNIDKITLYNADAILIALYGAQMEKQK